MGALAAPGPSCLGCIGIFWMNLSHRGRSGGKGLFLRPRFIMCVRQSLWREWSLS